MYVQYSPTFFILPFEIAGDKINIPMLPVWYPWYYKGAAKHLVTETVLTYEVGMMYTYQLRKIRFVCA